MKKTLISLIGSLTIFNVGQVFADDYGCQVLLCMSNPSGPTAVAECRPPIERLYRDLYERKPFPKCEFSKSPGNNVILEEGYEPFYPCNTGYDQVRLNGEDSAGREVCRKLIGYNESYEEGQLFKTPIYDDYPVMYRSEPFWVKVTNSTSAGQIVGQKFWYKKAKKKNGPL